MRTSTPPVVRWSGLAALGLAIGLAVPDAEAQRNVTLRLNTASIPDTVDVNDLIEVRGAVGGTAPITLPDNNVLDWNANSTVEPVNVGGDYWEVSFQIPDEQEMQFKFWAGENAETGLQTNDGGWETGGNWSIPAGTGDVDRELHYFNTVGASDYDWDLFEPSGPDSVAVWFRVFALTEEVSSAGGGDFDPTDGDDFGVSIRGNNALGGSQDGGATTIDWGSSNIELTREGDDSSQNGFFIYSGRVAFPNTAVGQAQAYKFVAQSAEFPDAVGWEDGLNDTDPDGNRTFSVPAQDTTIALAYFGDAAPLNEPLFTQVVVFQVDAQPLADVGLFSRSRGDSLQVRGEFNGWGCGNPDLCELERAKGTVIYERGVSFTEVDGRTLPYKYFVDLEIPFGTLPQDDINNFGYEEPLDNGGADRAFEFDGSGTNVVGPDFFNNIRAGNVIPEGEGSIDVTFEVNMAAARSFDEDAFDPDEDDVYVAFEDRLWQLTQGYEPDELTGGIDPGFTLSDPDGDDVYTGTFTVQTPTYNGIGYRYAYGDATPGVDDVVYDGQGGFDPCRRRYRYILPSGGSFPSSFSFARDAFRQSEVVEEQPELSRTPFEANPTDPDAAELIGTNFGVPGCLVLANGEADPFATSVEEVPGEVAAAVQALAFPNPVAATATIQYDVPQAGAVSLRVFDLVGREVAVLVDAEQAAAKYEATFDAAALAPGVYVYRLTAAGQAVSGKLTVVR